MLMIVNACSRPSCAALYGMPPLPFAKYAREVCYGLDLWWWLALETPKAALSILDPVLVIFVLSVGL